MLQIVKLHSTKLKYVMFYSNGQKTCRKCLPSLRKSRKFIELYFFFSQGFPPTSASSPSRHPSLAVDFAPIDTLDVAPLSGSPPPVGPTSPSGGEGPKLLDVVQSGDRPKGLSIHPPRLFYTQKKGSCSYLSDVHIPTVTSPPPFGHCLLKLPPNNGCSAQIT